MKFPLENNKKQKHLFGMLPYFLTGCWLLLFFGSIKGQDHLVNNYSKQFPSFLTNQQTEFLEQKLVNFDKATSNQIVIVIVDDFDGQEPSAYANQLGRKLGVGTKEHQNGILIVIKPTGSPGQRHVFIAVGRGLEGAIPDATAHQIVQNEITPNFKQGLYFKGLDDATNVLMGLSKGEFDFKQYKKRNDGGGGAWIIILLIIGFLLFSMFGRGGNNGYTMGGNGGSFLLGAMLGSMFGGGGMGGDRSNGGAEGFGGFGGGDFGGGGAGGSW